MSGEIDGLSQAIGRLQAQADQGQRERRRLFEKLDEIHDDLVALKVIKTDVDEMKPHVEHYRRRRQREIGAAGVLAFVGSGTVVGIWEAFKHLVGR